MAGLELGQIVKYVGNGTGTGGNGGNNNGNGNNNDGNGNNNDGNNGNITIDESTPTCPISSTGTFPNCTFTETCPAGFTGDGQSVQATKSKHIAHCSNGVQDFG